MDEAPLKTTSDETCGIGPAKSTELKRPFRVLAIDGGGIRGLYTASLLHSIAAHFEPAATTRYDVGRHFDLIAGTSTGGILACGLAARKTTAELVALYQKIGPGLFIRPQPDGTFKTLVWAMRNLMRAANPSEPLQSALKEIFGHETLGTIYAKRKVALCLPSCRLHDWTPKVFKTPHRPADYTRDCDVSLVDACLATSAAPIFLPVAEITEAAHLTSKGRFVDGGLWANNPVLIAMLEAIDLCIDEEGKHLNRPIVILSLGTSGGAPGDEPGSKANRGMAGWKFGGEAAGMSIDVQGTGYNEMAKRFAGHFRMLGFDIGYERVKNPHVTAAQAKELKLDRATPEALNLLLKLGDKAAQDVQAACREKNPLGEMVTSIFSQP